MADHILGADTIVLRLEKVERQNRIMKRIGLIMLLLITAAMFMGQAHSSRILEAEGFVLKDASGNTRATLGIVQGTAMLTLYGPQGGKTKGVATEIAAGPDGSFLWFLDQQGKRRISLQTLEDRRELRFFDSSDAPEVMLGAGSDSESLVFGTDQSLRAILTAGSNDDGTLWLAGKKNMAEITPTTLRLQDSEGFAVHLGQTDLVTTATGEKHRTSAASVVLFGKDQKVIWSAP